VNRSDIRLLAGCVLAVAVPAVVLHFTAGDERHAAGLTAAPFAWPRVLVGHLMTALPLGFLIAGRIWTVAGVNEAPHGLWVVAGLGLAGFAALFCPGIGESIAASDIGDNALLVLRAAIAVVLVLPWCVWAIDPMPTRAASHTGVWFAVCIGLALVPCGLYAEVTVTSRTAAANEYVTTGRLVKADRVLTGLVELGSDRAVAGKPPGELRRLLRKEIDRLTKSASYPLSLSASREARFARCGVLIQLDRLDEAAELIQPFATENVSATLLLATIDRDRERWASSDAYYEAALTLQLPKAATNAAVREDCRLAFDGLAYNARADHRPTDAEHALQRGLEALPSDAAYFHFQLGQHYANTGRPALAIEHLTKAVELDPVKHRDSANQLIQRLRTTTPTCILAR
jgi:hypothetical protein